MPGSIRFDLDVEAKILTIGLHGEVAGAQAVAEISAFWRAHPEVAGYDSMIDISEDEGAVSWNEVGRLAEMWHDFMRARGGSGAGRTALVVRNAQQEMIVSALTVKFPNRIFAAFGTPEAARAWLRGR